MYRWRLSRPEITMTYPCRVLTVSIECPVTAVAIYLADPRNFPEWASGLAGGLTPRSAYAPTSDTGSEWLTNTPEGPIAIRFSPANAFGVADHWVHLPDGTVVYVPLRAVANGEGSEVSLTLFRFPGMDAARFQADVEWVERDLASLKRVLEARPPS